MRNRAETVLPKGKDFRKLFLPSRISFASAAHSRLAESHILAAMPSGCRKIML